MDQEFRRMISIAYGLVLHGGSADTAAWSEALERIQIVPETFEALPPLSSDLPLVSFMREARTGAGLRIDLPRARGARERGYAVLLEPDGRRLRLARNPTASPRDVWHHLTRYLVRRLLAHRGALVLHGNLAARDGRSIAVLGRSGDGKSSLSVALLRAGAMPLADDVVRPARLDRGWGAWPGFGEILVEEETAARLGLDPGACAAFWEDPLTEERKVSFQPPGPAPAPAVPVPLAGIFALKPRGGADAPRLARLRGIDAVGVLACHAGSGGIGASHARRTRELLDLAGSVPVWGVERPDDLGALDATAHAILAAAEA